jgi:hypothetical protein
MRHHPRLLLYAAVLMFLAALGALALAVSFAGRF